MRTQHRAGTSDGSMHLGELITRLGPLNNAWRSGGTRERILALWDIGDVLLRHAPDASDNLLWELQDRSYMTRTVLRYSLIVRKGWAQRSELEPIAGEAGSYSLFREALPFLKGDRAGIDEHTYALVRDLLKSGSSTRAADKLKALKSKHIGRTHRKGTGAGAAPPSADEFAAAFRALRDEVAQGSPGPDASSADLLLLSQASMALAIGQVTAELQQRLTHVSGDIAPYGGPLREATMATRAVAAAFKNRVGAPLLMEAADLFNSLRSPDSLAAWRNRHTRSLDVTK